MNIDLDRPIAILTIKCEADNQSLEAKTGVAATFFNRLKLNKPERYGYHIAGICMKRYQYSEYNADRADNANLERACATPINHPSWDSCATAYQAACGGADPTGGATHYFDDSIEPPDWTIGATFCCKIDRLTFYKDVA